jgi:hypothetical protein
MLGLGRKNAEISPANDGRGHFRWSPAGLSAKKIAIPSAEALAIFIRDNGIETEIGDLVI